MGAALAYYTVFSLAPLLVIVISIAGVWFGADAARGEIVAELRGLLGSDGAAAVTGVLRSASEPEKSALASVIGGLMLLVGATSVLAELQSDLDRIWRVPATPGQSLWGVIRQRLLSFGLILALGFLLLVSLVINAALTALGREWASIFGGSTLPLQTVNLIAGFLIVTALFAMIYKMLPRARVSWEDVWIGAFVTAFLFSVGKMAIGFYLGTSGISSGFGAAGSLAVVLVWVYYSAQIFLLGAEFTWIYAHRYGSCADGAARVAHHGRHWLSDEAAVGLRPPEGSEWRVPAPGEREQLANSARDREYAVGEAGSNQRPEGPEQRGRVADLQAVPGADGGHTAENTTRRQGHERHPAFSDEAEHG
jgi:membrane protein